MRENWAQVLALGTGLLAVGGFAFAHHGTSVTYQTDKTITVKGTITEWVFSYPHPQIYFDVKGEHGEIQHWGSELGPSLNDEENERGLEQRLNETRRSDYPHLQPPQSDFVECLFGQTDCY